MSLALAGVGRMGSAIAGRLRAAGHELRLYDPALPPGEPGEPGRPGGEVAGSLREAAAGSGAVLLCLPDAAAVEASLPDLLAARPPLVIDLTSSRPATTRRIAGELGSAGVEMLDCPLSGGVAGARRGSLTAMAGGPPELVERAAPILEAFTARVLWAGPLGAGHAVKALNNALSAVALAVTSEMLVRAVAAGAVPAAVVAAWNAGRGRTQNSEVKFPRDVLSGRYAAGFSAGLMEKDVATALAMAGGHGLAVPVTARVYELWRELVAARGPGADFTLVYEHVRERLGRTPEPLAPGLGEGVIWSACLLAGRELAAVAAAEHVAHDRFCEIVSAGTGRSEATLAGLAGEVDREALAAAGPTLTLGAPGAG